MSVSSGQTIFNHNPSLSPTDFKHALKVSPLFKQLSDVLLKQLINRAPKRVFKMGDAICAAGEHGHSMYILVAGAVELGAFELTPNSKRWRSLKSIDQPGDSFGEESIISKSVRTTSAVSISDCTALIEIDLPLFSRLDSLSQGVLFSELTSHQRATLTQAVIKKSVALNRLSDRGLKTIIAQGMLLRLSRGERSALENSELTLLLKGLMKLTEGVGSASKTLLFLNEGDVLTTRGRLIEGLSLHASEPCILLRIQDPVFNALPEPDQALLKSVALAPPRQMKLGAEMPNTVFQFVEQMLDEGAQQGMSLLSIDLDQCVRCGQCVRACESRHGHARMTRRGRTVRRRRDIKVAGDYQSILLPSSCRHCSSPECMVGCPTSAIHRGPDGEVDIKDTCIGCASCANRCPYGNITMIPTPDREVGGVAYELKASKCNLCSGYDQPNCVNNCPTGAVIRVEPQQYFEEFAQFVQEPGRETAGFKGKTATTARGKRSHLILSLLSIVIAALGGGVAWIAPTSVWSTERMTLGVLTALFMLGAGLLAGRRRAAGRSTQLGALRTWTAAHLYLGGLSLIFMVYHTGGQVGRGLTFGLWCVTWVEVILGLAGWVLYRWSPAILTRLEGPHQIEEDARAQLLVVTDELASMDPELVSALQNQLGYPPKRGDALRSPQLLEAWTQQVELLPKQAHDVALQWTTSTLMRAKLEAYLYIHRLRRTWLITHLALSLVLAIFIVVHIASVIG